MKITRAAEINSIDQEKRQADFIISTESIDRHGTAFKMDGWDLSVYERNPIVCYNHDSGGSNLDSIIGTSEVFRDGTNLVGRVTFEDEGDNPIADKVWKKINKGTLKMASVGAIAHDYRYGVEANGEQRDTVYFTRQELLEWSVVSVGSNPDAFKRSAAEVDEIKATLVEPVDEMSADTQHSLMEYELSKIKY